MEKQYRWKVEGFFDKADANKVGKEIENLPAITLENMVEKARDENTELHQLFEWDDKKAGDKYRRIQANNILQGIQVVVKKDEETNEEKTTKAFVTLKKHTEYEPIEAVIKEPEKYNLLLERATEQLKKIRRNYEDVFELQDIFDLIDKL